MGKNLSLQQKAVCAVIFLAVVLAAVSAAVSYRVYTHNMKGYYQSMCRNVAWTAASVVDGIELERYVAQIADIYLRSPAPEFGSEAEAAAYLARYDGVMDEAYWELYHTLEKVRHANGALSLYIIYIDSLSKTYVYVMDIGNTENVHPVGAWEDIGSQDYHILEHPRQGFPGLIVETEEAGWICRAGVPVIRADGTVAAFVMADIPMDGAVKDRGAYMVKLCLALAGITVMLGVLSAYIFGRLSAEAEEMAEADTDAGIHGLAIAHGKEHLEIEKREDVS